MFFNSKPPAEPKEQPIEPKIEPSIEPKTDRYAKLKVFYFHEIDGHKFIMNLSKHFKASNAIVAFNDGTIWRVSYIGEVLEFLNNTIQQIGTNTQLNPLMIKWLDGNLPVNPNPLIEIGPDRILDYAIQAIRKYPTNECALYLEQLESFKARYDTCEIVQNLKNGV